MEGSLHPVVGVSVLVMALVVVAAGARGETYSTASYPYARDVVLAANDMYDAHEVTASVGKEISYTVRATAGGCVLVIFGLGHNFNANSYYLPAYSQETCVESFSKAYRVPSGGGPDFSIVVSTELAGDVAYHIDINVGDAGLGSTAALLGGVGLLAVVVALAIAIGVRRRRKAQAPAWSYPPYAPPPPPPPAPTAPPSDASPFAPDPPQGPPPAP